MSETVENLSTLKINYLTQEQYDAAVSSGIIQENELYLTPTSGEQSALPSGGLMGQVLAKSSDDDYAVAWATLSDSDSTFTIHAPRGVQVSTITEPFSDIVAAISAGKNIVLIDGLTKREYSLYEYANNYAYFAWSKTNSVGSNSDYAEIHYMNVYVKQATNSEAAICSRMNWGAKTLYTGSQIKAIVLPQGGSTDQILVKSSNDDYAVAWTTIHDIPAGGSAGQVLAKSSNDDYSVAWATLSSGSDKVMVVTITYSSTRPYYSSNKTIDEILTAIDNGYDVYLIYTGSYSGAAHEIYQLYSRSTTDVYFTRMNVSSVSIREDYFRIYKSNNDTLITKSNYYAGIPSVENQYYIVIKYDDSENKYFIDDYLNLTYLGYLDLTSGSYRFGSIFAYYSEEGNHLPETGGYENYADYYYLQKYWNTEEYDEGEGSYNTISHVIFSKIDNTNGTVKFKSFLIEGGSWDNLTDATVTYSEVSLGQPSAAAGVSF